MFDFRKRNCSKQNAGKIKNSYRPVHFTTVVYFIVFYANPVNTLVSS